MINNREKLLREFMTKRANLQEEIIWIGCNPSDPEMFKKQAEEGFMAMRKMSELAVEYGKKLMEIKDED